MSAFATLALTNNAAATVNFTPLGIDSAGIAKWGAAGNTYDLKPIVTMSVALPKSNGSVVRVQQKIVVPHADTVDVNKKIGESTFKGEFVLYKNATTTDKLNLRKFADTLIMHAVTTAAVQDSEGIY